MQGWGGGGGGREPFPLKVIHGRQNIAIYTTLRWLVLINEGQKCLLLFNGVHGAKEKKKKKKEMFYLTTHSSHFIYGYMASTIR